MRESCHQPVGEQDDEASLPRAQKARKPRRMMPEYGPDPTEEELEGMKDLVSSFDEEEDKKVRE